MPFKSEAQKKYFQKLLEQKQITKEDYSRMEAGTPKELPDRSRASGPMVIPVRRVKKY